MKLKAALGSGAEAGSKQRCVLCRLETEDFIGILKRQ